jgi:hypothetical protein
VLDPDPDEDLVLVPTAEVDLLDDVIEVVLVTTVPLAAS